MERASSEGLKVTAHFAEVANESEVEHLLGNCNDFKPDRLGHCTCIHPAYPGGSPSIWEKFKALKIPTEVCLSSNIACKSVDSYEKVRTTN